VGAVVTVAGNLDVAAWAAHHGYTPLADSLDPASLPDLRPEIRQVHFTGGRDTRVPPKLLAGFARTHLNAKFVHLPEFDHECCWERDWPAILHAVEHASGSVP
jgi:hypothetical protein